MTEHVDDAILAAIASGASINYLIGKWSIGDVASTLRRNHLAADTTGRICPATGGANVVLSLLRHHPSLSVKRQAVEASALSDRLCEAWRDWQDHHADLARIEAARAGVNALIDELEALQRKALVFARRLKTPTAPEEAA